MKASASNDLGPDVRFAVGPTEDLGARRKSSGQMYDLGPRRKSSGERHPNYCSDILTSGHSNLGSGLIPHQNFCIFLHKNMVECVPQNVMFRECGLWTGQIEQIDYVIF